VTERSEVTIQHSRARDRSLADVCVTACADVWRDDGEIVASPMGLVPTLGARLARATFAPDLLLTDGAAALVDADGTVEGWLPFRDVLDLLVPSGRRHVMMGASQVDRYGNQNISCIGGWARPDRQLLGVRGAPGNTVNHRTSYWVPRHSPRVFVAEVDMVSGVGYRRAAAAGPAASRYHDVHRVVSDLGVFDFDTPDRSMRLRSVHPGVTVDEVLAATGFDLVVADGVAQTRLPTDDELRLLDAVLDPERHRDHEVPARA
jgi:acyl CoA:acetate/3-ketoacid CoA transferase beta subunit